MNVIRKPIITERSSLLMQSNQYVLRVNKNATKGQIKNEIEQRFKVVVTGVHTVSMPGKYRRRTGPIGGYQSDWKKAIVRVKQGQKILWEETAK